MTNRQPKQAGLDMGGLRCEHGIPMIEECAKCPETGRQLDADSGVCASCLRYFCLCG
jgi:hypothetical protein